MRDVNPLANSSLKWIASGDHGRDNPCVQLEMVTGASTHIGPFPKLDVSERQAKTAASSITGVRMTNDACGSLQDEGVEALRMMEHALALLDQGPFSADVGAHLDHAICRLREVLALSSTEEGAS